MRHQPLTSAPPTIVWMPWNSPFEPLSTRLMESESDTMNTGTTHVGEMTPPTLNGMKPAEAIQLYMPWVDATTLTSVVAGILDVQQFIKLVPPEHRPKGQANLGLATGSHTDFATGKISLVNESTLTFEKIYPDYPTLAMAPGVYLAI